MVLIVCFVGLCVLDLLLALVLLIGGWVFGLICFGVAASLYLFAWCLGVSLICGSVVGYGFVVVWFLWY